MTSCKKVKTRHGVDEAMLLENTDASEPSSSMLSRAKEEFKRKLPKSIDPTKKAVKFFFKSYKRNNYLEEIKKCDNYSEENWTHHYDNIVSYAFEFESNIGTQAAISWALSCLKTMQIRITDSEKKFILLLKLAFVWYNFTLDLKYRYAADVEKVTKTFKVCKESFDKLIDECVVDKDKVLLNDVLNLVQASYYNKISNEDNMETKASEATIKQFVENFENENNLYIPHILIGLYYHQLALMTYVKGDPEAMSYLKDALKHLDLMQLQEDFTYRYFLDVVFDLTQFYDQEDLATKTSNKELLSKVYSTIKENECKYEKSPAAIIFHFALCSLSVHHVGEDDIIERHCNDVGQTVLDNNSEELAGVLEDYKDLKNTAGGHLSTTFFTYATALFPHFLKCNEFDQSCYVSCIRFQPGTALYGYKGIAVAVHSLVSIQYHKYQKEQADDAIVFADKIPTRVELSSEEPEVLTYLHFAKIFKAICNYRINKHEDGDELMNRTLDFSLENNFQSLVKLLTESMQCPNTCMTLSSTFVHNNNRRIVEKALISVAADQFRKNFPSLEENAKTFFIAFQNCATACAKATSTA